MMSLSSFIVRLMYGTERADNILLDSPKVRRAQLSSLMCLFNVHVYVCESVIEMKNHVYIIYYDVSSINKGIV